ncbi:MAG: serine acetyltransferase [Cytophagaceae bacterium]|nr:serine acetyltransferase [Cytophagaceae bacterium]
MLSDSFLAELLRKHRATESFPPTSSVARLMTRIVLTLFPEQTKRHYQTVESLRTGFAKIEVDLTDMLTSMRAHLDGDPATIARQFMDGLPEIYRVLNTDVQAILAGDPAAHTEYEVVRAYPGFYAITFYRLAHALHELEVPLLPRVLTEYAHSKTGIDIHPEAQIGENFYIDHGTGIVIGATSVIGNRVKFYQGVTLGALSVSKEMASLKRHPTVEDDVIIYANATILGGETIIGHGSVVGGNVWLTKSIPPYTKIYHHGEVKVL